jgi:group I intron endonuclease
MYLYIMTFPNGKKYVGITVNLGKRKSCHKSRAKNGCDYSEYLYNAINKYGWENIEWEVADGYESWDELCELEIEAIATYNTTNKDVGYNLTTGGDGYAGFTHTEEWKEMMSERMSGENSPCWGRKLTDEQKAHLSEINTGEKHPRYGVPISDMQKELLKAGFKQYCAKYGHPYKGRHLSEEEKANISRANSGKNNGMYGKPSLQSKLTDNMVREIRDKYASGQYTYIELAKEYNVGQTTIVDVVKRRKYKRIK